MEVIEKQAFSLKKTIQYLTWRTKDVLYLYALYLLKYFVFCLVKQLTQVIDKQGTLEPSSYCPNAPTLEYIWNIFLKNCSLAS